MAHSLSTPAAPGALPPLALQRLTALDARTSADGGAGLATELQRRGARVLLAQAAPHQAPPSGLAATPAPGPEQQQQQQELAGFLLYSTNSLAVHIIRVGVAPEARRRGLGRALVQVRCCQVLFTLHPPPTHTPLHCSVG